MIDRYLIQVTSFSIALAGVVVWLYWALKYRDRWLYSVAPISWLLHVAVFYFFVLLNEPPFFSEFFATWSAAIKLHGAILGLSAGAILIYARRKWPTYSNIL